MSETIRKLTRAWGDQPPIWILRLAEAVADSNRATVAHRLGYSRTAISLVLNNRYPGNPERIAESIEDLLMTIPCPILGPIAADTCENHRIREFQGGNHFNARLYRACQCCCHNPDRSE